MSFFYRQPAGDYRQHVNREGELVPANREWHERNGTYPFAYALGSVIVAFGVMIALHPWLPGVSAVGSFLVFVMSLVTLSFLVTTPECWVPRPGRPGTRLPAAVRLRPARRQGRHHGRRGPGDDGRLGEGLPAERATAARAVPRGNCPRPRRDRPRTLRERPASTTPNLDIPSQETRHDPLDEMGLWPSPCSRPPRAASAPLTRRPTPRRRCSTRP